MNYEQRKKMDKVRKSKSGSERECLRQWLWAEPEPNMPEDQARGPFRRSRKISEGETQSDMALPSGISHFSEN